MYQQYSILDSFVNSSRDLNMFDWNAKFSGRANRIQASEIREMAAIGRRPGFISFAGGSPATEGFPFEETRAIADELFVDQQSRVQALQYGVSDGYPPLREFIANYVIGSVHKLPTDNVLITSGAQQSLDFIGKILLNVGDRVITTFPTFPGMLQALNVYAPIYANVGTETGEVDLDLLEKECQVGGKLIYLMPDYCNPTGLSMSVETRKAIVQIARKYEIVLVEDHPYDELRYVGDRLEPMLAYDDLDDYDQRGNIIYLGTFSKSLAPGFRVGWMIAPSAFVQKGVLMKQASDIQSGSLNQMLVHRLAPLLNTDYIDRLRGHYRGRRLAMLTALAKHMPAGASWSTPDGGFFLWVRLPDALDAAKLLQTAIEFEKVTFIPGVAFYTDKTPRSALRLSFSSTVPEKIDDGVQRICRAIDRVV